MTTSSGEGLDCTLCMGDNRVVDSRPSPDPAIVKWRRRQCLACGERYTTVEITDSYYAQLVGLQRRYMLDKRIKEGLQDARAYGSHFPTTP